MSTNEIVARNQPSRLDFHKTLTPMIGKENFELRKKLFEHSDDFSFTGKNLLFLFFHSRWSLSHSDVVPCQLNDPVNNSKASSRQSLRYLTYHNVPWKLKIRKEVWKYVRFSPTFFISLEDLFPERNIRSTDIDRSVVSPNRPWYIFCHMYSYQWSRTNKHEDLPLYGIPLRKRTKHVDIFI